MGKISFSIQNKLTFPHKIMSWANSCHSFCYFPYYLRGNILNSFNNSVFFGKDILAVSIKAKDIYTLKGLEDGWNNRNYKFGHFGYDFKNYLEKLSSNNEDLVGFSDLNFFEPDLIFRIFDDKCEVEYFDVNEEGLNQIIDDIVNQKNKDQESRHIPTIKPKISKETYIDTINKLKKHINHGDVYEINFCMEFFAENVQLNSIDCFNNLIKLSPMPFSVLYKMGKRWAICASPERFLKKQNNTIISQPIKGTAPRFTDDNLDFNSKNNLKNNQKERSENIMAVDVVRNDLSRIAQKDSVKVKELCEVYSYQGVHQMISTVTAEKKQNVHSLDAIKLAFPMASMTGAPKIRAMELIEQYEVTKRGLYSGTIGYITPEGDFDFNVVIRSILYNEETKYLSFMVGSAITAKSDAEKEYEECMLKAQKMFQALGK